MLQETDMESVWNHLKTLWALEVFGNPVSLYLTGLGWLLIGYVALFLANHILLRQLRKWAERTSTNWDDFLLDQVQKRLIPFLYFLIPGTLLKNYSLSPMLERIVDQALVVLFTLSLLLFLTSLIRKIILDNEIKALNESQKIAFKGLYPALQTVIWIVGLLFLLDNFGLDISAAIAGLGIGGVAVALAAQAILGDLFSYFAILLDRPFELGDFIIVGEFMGTVEHIGLKTTRLRSLSGEQVIMANHDLTSSRVRNYKRMFQRRVVFRLGILYETPIEKVEIVPNLIRNAIEQQADVRFDRSHFFSFGSYALEFEAVYFVLDGDYTHYMDVQQAINLAILRLFAREGIQFAYPTQVVYVANAPTG